MYANVVRPKSNALMNTFSRCRASVGQHSCYNTGKRAWEYPTFCSVDVRKQCLLFRPRIYAGSACYFALCHDMGSACYDSILAAYKPHTASQSHSRQTTGCMSLVRSQRGIQGKYNLLQIGLLSKYYVLIVFDFGVVLAKAIMKIST